MEGMTDGIVTFIEEFEKDLPFNIAVAVLGESFRRMPVDTGHMMRKTRLVKTPKGEAQLQTLTSYAHEQYSTAKNHLIIGGEYKSISRSVTLSRENWNEVKKMVGGRKFKESYWRKYLQLKAEGKLTQSIPEWFLKAYEYVASTRVSGIIQKSVTEARAKAKRGSYYKETII